MRRSIFAAALCLACAGHVSGADFGDCVWQRRPWRYEGLEPCFNCGCGGSYKFPVPPLYTYHWPGMYSARWMTEYKSPWRYPPLRPYVDEPPAAARPVGQTAGGMEAMSSKLLR
jgi:hypothetical protein